MMADEFSTPTTDFRFVRPRVGARLWLLPAQIADVVCQPEVLRGFSVEELTAIMNVIKREFDSRADR
jgi:hypothetical protein